MHQSYFIVTVGEKKHTEATDPEQGSVCDQN